MECRAVDKKILWYKQGWATVWIPSLSFLLIYTKKPNVEHLYRKMHFSAINSLEFLPWQDKVTPNFEFSLMIKRELGLIKMFLL